MKELTTEQKAQRYDEAIKVAKSKIKNDKDHVLYEDDVIEMFPELAESDDERIKKELITIISCAGDNSSHIYMSKRDSERYVAWLEKQGEQKPAAKYKVGDTVYYDSFGRLVSFIIANIIEDGTDNPMYEDKDGNSIFQNDIVEQKPAWSEEDENIRLRLIDYLYGKSRLAKDREDGISWLEFLKDRVQLLPKQEWSEEDERTYESILYAFEHRFPLNCEQQKFVKSLRPQKIWKPSDKQMEVLNTISNKEILSGYESGMLIGLYTELQKLREE